MTITAITGYAAMAVLFISFLPKNMTWVRSVNLLACILFVVYGVLLGNNLPIIISNGAIALLQCYHLFFRKKAVA